VRTETLVVATGRVQWAKADSYSLVRTRTANLRVYWAGGVLPPSVFVGNTVNFAGRLITLNEGKIMRISDAVPFPGAFWSIVEPLYAYLWHFLEDPREWCSAEIVDRQRWEA
jgi:hypothetical protein